MMTMKASITSTFTPATTDQKKQIRRLFEDAINKALKVIPLDKAAAQCIINASDGESIQDLVLDKFRTLTQGQHVGEEVGSKCTYPDMFRVSDLATQAAILHESFPTLDCSFDPKFSESKELSVGADGRFVIPPWQKIASTYGKAVEDVLYAIEAMRKFYNNRKGKTGMEYLRETTHKAVRFKKLADEQKGFGLVVVDGQLGRVHRGRSALRVREMLMLNEFCFGVYEVAIMLLTNPGRLIACMNLWIDCSGDEASCNKDWDYTCIPFFSFSFAPFFSAGGDRLKFDYRKVDHANKHSGSSSGFLP